MSLVWDRPPHGGKGSAICDVGGLGRLYVRREKPGSRKFLAFVNGRQEPGTFASPEKAKAHLETFVATSC